MILDGRNALPSGDVRTSAVAHGASHVAKSAGIVAQRTSVAAEPALAIRLLARSLLALTALGQMREPNRARCLKGKDTQHKPVRDYLHGDHVRLITCLF